MMKYLLFLIFVLLNPFALAAETAVSATTWEYDEHYKLKELIEFSDTPSRRVTRFNYDANGRISAIIKPDGTTLFHKVDAQNRLLEFHSSDGSVHYVYHYDGQGNLVRIENPISGLATVLEFDDHGRLTQHLQENGLKVGYTHPDSQTFCVTLPDHSTIAYKHGGDCISSIMRKNSSGTLLYTHSFLENEEILPVNAGKLKKMSSDDYLCETSAGIWKEWVPSSAFNANNQIESIETKDPLGPETTRYFYDEQQQLVKWADSSGKCTEYSYDPLGNRIQENQDRYEVDLCNQTLGRTNFFYTYDLNGNISSRTDKNGTLVFKYDALDRLVEVLKENDFKILYEYDGYHRRQTQTIHIWDSANHSWLQQSANAFLYFGNVEIGVCDPYGAMKQLRILCNRETKAVELPSGTYSAIQDHQGNIRCLIDIRTGKAKEFYRYSPFGEEQIYNERNECIPAREALNRWRFSGKTTDSETGLVYFGPRYYCPEIGKWATPDPIGFRDGPNRYLYAMNDPINRIDPYGLFSTPLFIGKIGKTLQSWKQVLQEYSNKYNSDAYFDENVEGFVKFFIGKGLFSLSSFNSEPRRIAKITGSSPSSARRITFINGIMNSGADMERYAKNISNWHEHPGESVYYVYRGTGGWTRDIIKCIFIKLGYISEDATDLANIWKNLIREMGGAAQGGEIVHWAHSIGGTETLRAQNLLTPEEQKMIKVIALGSPSMIPNKGFKNVINHISYRDGVGTLLDPIGFLHAFLFRPDHVDFKGSIFDGYPLVDHVFDVYMRYLEKVLENNSD